MADSRLEIDVADLAGRVPYQWLSASVVPRAIAWVCTVSAAGVVNLAPHSFFTVASADPPGLCFTSVGTKDTLRNIRATGEFVVNVVSRALAERVNLTSADFPADVDELAAAGLTPGASALVAPPHVMESPVAFECVAAGEHVLAEHDGTGSTVVFGRVVHVSARRDVLAGDGLPDLRALDPASRLGRDEWADVGEVFRLARPRYRDLAGGGPTG